jgi:hypothetical protein
MKSVTKLTMPFRDDFLYYIVTNKAAMRKLYKKYNMSEQYEDLESALNNMGAAWTFSFPPLKDKTNSRIFIIYINTEDHPKTSWEGTAIHEAAHIVRGYLQMLGEYNPSEEFYAYTVEYITTRALKALRS